MHPAKEELIQTRMDRTAENLRRNNMEAVCVKTKEAALALVKEYLREGDTIGCGGSVTLEEAGILNLLRAPSYHFLDRYRLGLTKEEQKKIFIDSLSADVYLMSTNAVTEHGELYNVDGRSNRTAALLYGPASVIVVTGYNKIVTDLDEAVLRVKTIAAPANAKRLFCPTPCAMTGKCSSLMKAEHPAICDGCASDRRICSNYVISAYQEEKGRIKVILVGEALGF